MFKNVLLIRVLSTIFILSFLRFINIIPLLGIDYIALKKDNIETSILGISSFYRVFNAPIINPLSLGLFPYISSSFLIDMYSNSNPELQMLKAEQGRTGKKKWSFYKKILAVFIAIIQGVFLVKSLLPYLYQTTFNSILEILWIFITGTLITIWSANTIDKIGIGTGSSLIIFSTIIINLFGTIQKHPFTNQDYLSLFFFFLFCIMIYDLKQKIYFIDITSAYQLYYLEEKKKKIKESLESELINSERLSFIKKVENGLIIKPSQGGIVPIILVTNVFPSLVKFFNIEFETNLGQIIYFCLIIIFNYFYTSISWDPKKISEELKKNSVTLTNINSGIETIRFLEKILLINSIYGGVYLSFILFSYQIIKNIFDFDILNKISISSLIILITIASEIRNQIKTLKIYSKYITNK